MARNIAYIINPIAGTRKKTGLRQLIDKKTSERNIPYKIFPSAANGDYHFLKTFATKEKITDIVIAGGDGTVNQVISHFPNEKINFGIIPCGSGNGLAFAASIPKDYKKALDIIFDGQPKPVDAFTVNDRFACMLCGLGFDAQVAHGFAHRSRRGLANYIREVLKDFLSARPYPFNIHSGENDFETTAYFISVANSNQFGNNFRIAPEASLSDGLLDVVVIACHGKISLAFQTFRQVRGWNKLVTGKILPGKKRVIYFQADELVIKNPALAPMHIDGEPVETGKEIKVKILKDYFNLIQPS